MPKPTTSEKYTTVSLSRVYQDRIDQLVARMEAAGMAEHLRVGRVRRRQAVENAIDQAISYYARKAFRGKT